MKPKEKLLAAIGIGACATIALLALHAYASPSMLIDFANLRFCG